ncbi:MAG: hypothetical protein WDW38_004184 [Sanguina aurantia]
MTELRIPGSALPDHIDQAKLRALLLPGIRPASQTTSRHAAQRAEQLQLPQRSPPGTPPLLQLRQHPPHLLDDGETDHDLPSDLDVAITHLTAGYHAWLPSRLAPPLLLKTHIYSILKDRTQTDRDLETLRRSREILLFKLSTGMDEHAILRTSDYAAILRSTANTASAAAGAAQGRSGAPPTQSSTLSQRSFSGPACSPGLLLGLSRSASGPPPTTQPLQPEPSDHTTAVERFLAHVVKQGAAAATSPSPTETSSDSWHPHPHHTHRQPHQRHPIMPAAASANRPRSRHPLPLRIPSSSGPPPA